MIFQADGSVLLWVELITLFGKKATIPSPPPVHHHPASIQERPNNGRVNNTTTVDDDVLPDNRTIGPVHY